jgi:hypothetical protein
MIVSLFFSASECIRLMGISGGTPSSRFSNDEERVRDAEKRQTHPLGSSTPMEHQVPHRSIAYNSNMGNSFMAITRRRAALYDPRFVSTPNLPA